MSVQTTRVSRLENPTDAQIEEMSLLTAEAFENSVTNRTMIGGADELRVELFRLTFKAAALEGRIYVCSELDSGRIVSLAAGFEPGTRFLGSDAQKSLGLKEFYDKLSDDTKSWWDTNMLQPRQGPVNERVQRSLRLIIVATLGSERRKGLGSILMKEIARTAGHPIYVNVISDDNIMFYKQLGFEVIGSSNMSSSFGSWVGTTMIWEDAQK